MNNSYFIAVKLSINSLLNYKSQILRDRPKEQLFNTSQQIQ